MNVVKKAIGICLLLVCWFFFVVFMASINAPESMGGPMNMSPSGLQWFLLVLFIDVVLLVIAVVAARLLGVSHRVTGGLLLLSGLSVFALGVSNQMNSPHVDDLNKGSLMPVAPELNILVYAVSGICLIAGVVLMFRLFRRSGVLPMLMVLAAIGFVVFGTLIERQHAREQTALDANLIVDRQDALKKSSRAEDHSAVLKLDSREFEDKLVKGAPFSATLRIEQPEALADGTSTIRTVVSLIYRDDKGRTRRDQMHEAPGAEVPVLDQPLSINIKDPSVGSAYVLNPRTKIAHRSTFVPRFEPGSNESTQNEINASAKPRTVNSQVLPLPASSDQINRLQTTPAATSSNIKRESLGLRQIEGIVTEGTRVAMTIPSDRTKNGRAIEIVTERWYSPSLQTLILIEQSDSRFGKSVYRLTDIKTGEPSPSLFVVPNDYKIRP